MQVNTTQDRRTINYSKLKEIMLQNVSRAKTKTFTQYTKDLIKQYLRNPYSNIDNIREVSRFLMRNSMIYKKIISYFAQMPLFTYNVIYKSDYNKSINQSKFLKQYNDIAQKLHGINMRKEFSTVIGTALRDGAYFGFVYDNDGDGFFLYGLDPRYCKVSGITEDGEYIFSFNVAFFDQGNNIEYIEGVNGNTDGIWDDVFVKGYNDYKLNGRDFMWVELPFEKTLCLLADEICLYDESLGNDVKFLLDSLEANSKEDYDAIVHLLEDCLKEFEKYSARTEYEYNLGLKKLGR